MEIAPLFKPQVGCVTTAFALNPVEVFSVADVELVQPVAVSVTTTL
jgi:hypothetical protein